MAKGRIRSTLSSLAQNWSMTRKTYPALPFEVGGLFVATFLVVAIPIGLLLNWVTAVILALPAALLAATFWFSRRAMRAAYKQIDGQSGAAAAVIQSIRGNNWAVTPAVAVNKSQDIITRVVGRPGVVLVSEGPSSRRRISVTSPPRMLRGSLASARCSFSNGTWPSSLPTWIS